MNETDPAHGDAEAYWETFYRDRADKGGRGRPNRLLVDEVAQAPAGRALDLGCAHGVDAIWLARNGWDVTAVDISATAVVRTARRAAREGVADRVNAVRHDLSRSFPEGVFDLVSAQYLQSPVAPPGERVGLLRAAAGRVAPAGSLLVVSHAGWPTWMSEPPFPYVFSTNAQLLAELALDLTEWTCVTDKTVVRDARGPSGQPGRRSDHVLHLRRLQQASDPVNHQAAGASR